MSDIATKLTTVAENQQKVYDAGHEKGVADGRQAEWSYFWNHLTNGGMMLTQQYAFYNWAFECFKPKYDLVLSSNATCAFSQMHPQRASSGSTDFAQLLKDCGVELNTSYVTVATSMFESAWVTKLPKLDFSKATLGKTFSGCASLIEIEEIVSTSATKWFSNTFGTCSSLREVRVSGVIGTSGLSLSPCSLLSHDSIMSFVNALMDVSSASGTYKITLGSTNLAKLTDDEIGQIESKGWTYA